MNDSARFTFIDPDDLDNNPSANPSLASIVEARMSRRTLLRGSLASAATALFGSLSISACGSDDDGSAAPAAGVSTASSVPESPPSQSEETLLGFTAVAKTLADTSTVPAGYTATMVFATGDPLAAGVRAYKNDGSDTGFDRRCGDCHDGMEYFGLSATGTREDTGNDRALLGINFESIVPALLHPSGPAPMPRPPSEADIEIDCHGVGVVEFVKKDQKFNYVPDSPFNRRITGSTEIEIAGPARGHPLMVTRFSPDGTRTRGTINNCGTGKTPWGTLLTGEENWSGYFFRAAGDQNLRTPARNLALARYGRNVTDTAAAASRYGWETAGSEDRYGRWNASQTGASADGSDDYRNEIHGQGYVTEIDPYDPASVVRKRTALGRFAHESAALGRPVAGKPLAIYMGCDAQNEYIYKFVSEKKWIAADASRADRMTVGDEYLNEGRLYVASLSASGTGRWLELSMDNPLVAGYAAYPFDGAGDIVINARVAADAAGATKMDRPEWCGVHPSTGEVYFTMTNNSARRAEPTGTQTRVDAANPRAYSDLHGGLTVQNGNVNGHILRLKEENNDPSAAFSWDVYLFGAEAGSAPASINLSGLTEEQPKDCEVTGMCETPDGKVMFVNVQHPGESIKASDLEDPSKYTSQWPANAGYGAGKRPRSGTVMITKNDGGRIGT